MKFKAGFKILIAVNLVFSTVSSVAFAGSAKEPGDVAGCKKLHENCKAWLADIEEEGKS